MKTNATSLNDVSCSFVAQHLAEVTAILHCWDRLRFQGSIPTLQREHGLYGFLRVMGVLLKDFSAWSKELTGQIRQHARQMAQAAGQTVVNYLRSPTERKEELARAEIQRRGLTEGFVGVWSAVEPCRTFFLRKDAKVQRLVLESGQGKCLHLYFYFLHQVYGLLHLRLQTWFPFQVTVGLNGHEWLARQMQAAGLDFTQCDNAFRWLQDPAAAQALADAQHQSNWPGLLQDLLQRCHPLAAALCAPIRQSYYWSLKESEFSTDVLFRSPEALAQLYPRLVRHGIEHFGSTDILRFLGKRVPVAGVHGNFEGEVNSSLARRVEGVRLKHYVAGNSLKMYDKGGSILRVETTINHPAQFRVWREGEKEAAAAWKPMRKGIADLHRRAEVSQAANERYLEAYAAVDCPERTGEVADAIFRPVTRGGRRHRALNPWTAADAKLLALVNQGEWLLNGLRNGDLRRQLFGDAAPPEQRRSQASHVTRLLRLLRAHGLLRKVPHTHRYQLTEEGRKIISAVQTARATSLPALLKLAA